MTFLLLAEDAKVTHYFGKIHVAAIEITDGVLSVGDTILLSGQNTVRGDEWWAVATATMVALAPMVVLATLLGRLMRSGLVLGGIK